MSILSCPKDLVPDDGKYKVIYKINFADYDVRYVGQTGGASESLLLEHQAIGEVSQEN